MSSTRGPDPDSAVWWFRLALGDLGAARSVASNVGLAPRIAASLAQQAAEKALKAAIAFAGTDPPRTHELMALSEELRTLGLEIDAAIDLVTLTDGVRSGRYPDSDEPGLERPDVAALVAAAQLILDVVRDHLVKNGVELDGISPV